MTERSYTQEERQRRDAIVRAITKRSQLTAGVPPKALDKAFLQRLKKFDDQLDMSWNPIHECWVLYRVIRRGATADGDTLLMVSQLSNEPGEWVLDLCRKSDLARLYPDANTAQRAGKLLMDDIDRKDELREEKADKELTALHERLAEDLRPICRDRKMELANETEFESAEPRRKVIWKDGAPTSNA